MKTTLDERVMLAHGGGGLMSRRLIEEMFVTAFSNRALSQLGDSAVVEAFGGRLAFTTDSYVIKPLFFRGGDIGRLAVCGTVNDLAMAGARPLYISLSLIIEEGFSLEDLRRIVDSVKLTASEVGVAVVAGDTKVVEQGAAEGLFITTSGIGVIEEGINLGAERIRPGDAVLLNGGLAEHGIAILSQRGEYDFQTILQSDVAPLSGMVESVLAVAPDVRFMRDLTRGGLAAALNEMADFSGRAVEIDERSIPVRDDVLAACEILGLDPLHVANEGKCMIVCAEEDCERVLNAMRRHACGRNSARIGRVVGHPKPLVFMRTAIGGTRIVDMPSGRLLPRIC